MRISFAGGAEYFNCDKLFAAGIWPITVATTILKPCTFLICFHSLVGDDKLSSFWTFYQTRLFQI